VGRLVVPGLDHQAAGRRTARWPPLPQPKVPEVLLDHRRVLDHPDQPHLAAAAPADENVFAERPPEQIGLREPAIAARVVGAGQVAERIGEVVLLRINRINRNRSSACLLSQSR
jgi:hypothetical protein